MLQIKMFISNAVQQVIQTNKNGEFAGQVQIKLPRIPEAPGCSLVVEHITVGRSFSQLFEVEPKHCVVKMRITCQDLTSHRISQNPGTTTGCLTEPEVPFFRFSRGLWNPG